MPGSKSVLRGAAVVLMLACACTGKVSGDSEPAGVGGDSAGAAGTGGSAAGASGMGGIGNAAGGGGIGNAPGGGGIGNAPGGGGTGGAGASCPASSTVTVSDWTASPWTAPTTGTAESVYKLSKETWKHYERLDLDLDFDVKSIEVPFVCFLELRNVGANQTLPYPWRYFSVCFKNGDYQGDTKKKLIYVVYDAVSFAYLVQTYTLKNNTSYSLNIVWDAKALQTTLTLTESGGSPMKLTQNPITSSIVPQGQGLDLLVGFNTNHPDYKKGIIKPPWGWVFKNLKLSLTPGGPYGSEAPPCP